MTVQDQLNRQKLAILERIKMAELLSDPNCYLHIEILDRKVESDIPEDIQRKIIDQFVREGVLVLANNNHLLKYIDTNGGTSYFYEGHKGYGGIDVAINPPVFNAVYDALQGNGVVVHPEGHSVSQQWLIFTSKDFSIFYCNHSFYINEFKKSFYPCHKGKLPIKIWDLACRKKSLFFSAEDLLKELNLKDIGVLREAVNKTHRPYFLKRLNLFCSERDILIPESLPDKFLKWADGGLHLLHS